MFPSGRGSSGARQGSNGGPFGGFPSFSDPFGGIFGRGGGRSLIEQFMGRDPFDDPFFRRPFGGIFGPPVGFVGGDFQRDVTFPSTEHRRGPVIEELPDDHEGSPLIEPNLQGVIPVVEHPDDDEDSSGNEDDKSSSSPWSSQHHDMPFTRTSCYQSSMVSGSDGVYYSTAKKRLSSNGFLYDQDFWLSNVLIGGSWYKRSSMNKMVLLVLKPEAWQKDLEIRFTLFQERDADERESTVETLQNLTAEEADEFDITWKKHAKSQIHGSENRPLSLGHAAGANRPGQLHLLDSEHTSGEKGKQTADVSQNTKTSKRKVTHESIV